MLFVDTVRYIATSIFTGYRLLWDFTDLVVFDLLNGFEDFGIFGAFELFGIFGALELFSLLLSVLIPRALEWFVAWYRILILRLPTFLLFSFHVNILALQLSLTMASARRSNSLLRRLICVIPALSSQNKRRSLPPFKVWWIFMCDLSTDKSCHITCRILTKNDVQRQIPPFINFARKLECE